MHFTETDWDPVVDSLKDKYSWLSIVQYGHSENVITRRVKNREEIGLFVDNPLDVLKQLFDDYKIVIFNGNSLFSDAWDVDEPYAHMKGLCISARTPVRGISGSLDDLLKSGELEMVKRDSPVPQEEIDAINLNLSVPSKREGECNLGALARNYKQRLFDSEQITGAIMEVYSKKK